MSEQTPQQTWTVTPVVGWRTTEADIPRTPPKPCGCAKRKTAAEIRARLERIRERG